MSRSWRSMPGTNLHAGMFRWSSFSSGITTESPTAQTNRLPVFTFLTWKILWTKYVFPAMLLEETGWLKQCFSTFFEPRYIFNWKKSQGTPTIETVKKWNSVAYINNIQPFLSKCLEQESNKHKEKIFYDLSYFFFFQIKSAINNIQSFLSKCLE